MAGVLLFISWWTGINPAEASQSLLELLGSLAPKLIALIAAFL